MKRDFPTTHREFISLLKDKIQKAEQNLKDYYLDQISKYPVLPLADTRNNDEVKIGTMGEEYDVMYYPTFDKIKVVEDKDGEKSFRFHVADGDEFSDDDTWVADGYFQDDAWKNLFDYIQWPEDKDNNEV